MPPLSENCRPVEKESVFRRRIPLDKGTENPYKFDERGNVLMKGDPKLTETLNDLLADELTAINQYIVHAEMCENWGYGKLHEHFEKRAIDEMKHMAQLIARILFLEGMPIVTKLNPIHIGSDVPKMFLYDHEAEAGAIAAYNAAIKLAGDVGDFATRELLQQILKDEDEHIDAIEENQDQIGHMTIGIYLTTKVDA